MLDVILGGRLDPPPPSLPPKPVTMVLNYFCGSVVQMVSCFCDLPQKNHGCLHQRPDQRMLASANLVHITHVGLKTLYQK